MMFKDMLFREEYDLLNDLFFFFLWEYLQIRGVHGR